MILQILIGIIVLVAIPVSIIIKLRMDKQIKKVDVTINMPLVENDYRKMFTEGYTRGVLKKITPCKNGTNRIEFFPNDVEQGEDIPLPPLQAFIVKNEYIKPFSLGELSSRRIIIKTITRNPSLIPDKIRDTTEGKWVTKEGQLGFIKATFGKGIPAGDEAIAEAMKEYARGNIAKGTLAEIKTLNAEFRKLNPVIREGTEEKPIK